MQSKIDYLTLTLKSKSKTLDEALSMLGTEMVFDDLLNQMTQKGGAGFYDYHLSYEHVEFYFTTPERFNEQGICIKFSSQGLDYFARYLSTYKLDIKKWLRNWRALAFGDWVTKCTRFDYAMDDIAHNNECPTMTMSHVIRSANNGEICKKAKTVDILCGNEISARDRIKYCEGKPLRGRTLYVGVRQSDRLLRFYDKRAEQLQNGREVPKDISHWTRCELELHKSDAMGALNAFLDMPDDEFAAYMRGVVNNQCRFIVHNNENISRCPSKRWWTAFLNGCTKCFKLPKVKPARSALGRAERGLRQYIRTIYTMYQVLGLEGLYSFFEREVNKLKSKQKEVVRVDLLNNFDEADRDYEEMSSVKNYLYASDYAEDELVRIVQEQQHRYKQSLEFACRDEGCVRLHSAFVHGQEVLADGL